MPRLEEAMLPIWAFLLVTIIMIVVSLEFGYRFGLRRRSSPRHDSDKVASDLATPIVGLLGLMLAFTFGWSATRFDSRRAARLEEAEATERLFRYADFLEPANRDRIRAVLLRYVDVSIGIRDVKTFENSFAEREKLHRELWKLATGPAIADPHSTIGGQVVQAANDVLDAHLARTVLASSNRIPHGIRHGLIAIIAIAMAMIGYQLGIRGEPRSPMAIPLTAALALVLFLIIDLDRPIEGWLQVRDQALEQAKRELTNW